MSRCKKVHMRKSVFEYLQQWDLNLVNTTPFILKETVFHKDWLFNNGWDQYNS
ncbi:hypothetical protein VMF7928_03056 [Vibrio marisflavi CECT 7928]|uniref:Uncharacterized protein n=1 Tax=Vibrio marisflavi CECT 7928 TaxID=634439 RepID=A0ABM9A614_9VIBR|nr:hypothetical protein VMF7928_03056 [Vibrio marisflavi CECT 7928]